MSDIALAPPERKQRLSDERVAEIGQIAAGMAGDLPVAGWLGDLCADLFDARAMLADARRAALEEAAKALEAKMPMEERASTLLYAATIVRALQKNPADPAWMHCGCEHCKAHRGYAREQQKKDLRFQAGWKAALEEAAKVFASFRTTPTDAEGRMWTTQEEVNRVAAKFVALLDTSSRT